MNETTQIIHYGDTPEAYFGAVNPPVVRASLFGYHTYQEFLDAYANRDQRPLYSRDFNPTVNVLEQKIAALEHADRAIAFSSGMGAITAALLALLKQGDHLLMVDCVYGPARQFSDTLLTRLGVEVEYFPAKASKDLSEWIRENTSLIYLESPGSLTFDLQDLRAAADCAQARDIPTLADNSWATPLYQKPRDLGIDIVVHSGTKYIAGHSDLTLGLLACSQAMFDKVKPVAVLLGANLSPDDAYLALRGLRTLPLRLQRHQATALKIANWLADRPEVRQVLHPGLPNFEGHDLARQQLSGYGSLFSFTLQPGTEPARHAFVDTLELFLIGVSWGGYESLVLPLAGDHKGGDKLRAQAAIDKDTFRVSIGLEDADDLITDLEKGLAAWRQALG